MMQQQKTLYYLIIMKYLFVETVTLSNKTVRGYDIILTNKKNRQKKSGLMEKIVEKTFSLILLEMFNIYIIQIIFFRIQEQRKMMIRLQEQQVELLKWIRRKIRKLFLN